MKSMKAVLILILCATCLEAKIIIPTAQEDSYYRTLDRAEDYNKALEAEPVYLSCQVDGNYIKARYKIHKIIKKEKFYFEEPATCTVVDGKLKFKLISNSAGSWFDALWNPTSAFFAGLFLGALAGYGIGSK